MDPINQLISNALETAVRAALTPPLRVGPLSFHERGQNRVQIPNPSLASERRVGDESGLLGGVLENQRYMCEHSSPQGEAKKL